MKMPVVVVGTAEEIVGYKLAGVSRAYDIKDKETAGKLKKERSLVFLSRHASESLEGDMDEIQKNSIVFEIPQRGVPYTRVGDIIRDTIGFDLRR